ncbi:MAG: DUF4914 family protein [Planctomycetes bacterium]|jgi:hypothetical protein|nr:DUF4914 family protein [Phycisphaerae bacterium]NBB96498.1 DUF4914 family protein [Planctomycetota bacterium]
MNANEFLTHAALPAKVADVLSSARSVSVAGSMGDLDAIACGPAGDSSTTVSYELPDGSRVDEVDVVRLSNGVGANYREPYMRRRDPECMVVADAKPSDKPRFSDRFDDDFAALKEETFEWLKQQDLAIFAFEMGRPGLGADALAICPANAGFFAFGLGLLQGIVDIKSLGRQFKPATIIYVAPPFRHTHFDGKQVVVHERSVLHEIFSYNLYPGPSAKKGVYGALIELGEQQGWVTAHCSTVRVMTPYDNRVTFMHEGASGGGKSEMLQQPHRLPDGRLLMGRNIVTGEERHLEIPRTCDLYPVCDDMALCHPAIQTGGGRLGITDAESGWFVRVDHIREYGTDPDLEHLTVHPDRSLLFLNVRAVVGGTGLIWEHVEDEPGKPCPNPRVIVPRAIVPHVVSEPLQVDVRSFGVRTPPCTRDHPSYGILGMFHLLPPALAWLWRLVAPRGHANPSIVETGGMTSEGVGSYWPFTTGKRVAQANLLLSQFQSTPATRYVLTPNQHIGAWKTGFMPQWLMRDYLARRGVAPFRSDQVVASRCPLLGYALQNMRIEGTSIHHWFLEVDTQPDVGPEAFDEGARILTEFFHRELQQYLQPELDDVGRNIIECCLSNGHREDYENIMPGLDQIETPAGNDATPTAGATA